MVLSTCPHTEFVDYPSIGLLIEFVDDLQNIFTETNELTDLNLMKMWVVAETSTAQKREKFNSSMRGYILPWKERIVSKDMHFFLENMPRMFPDSMKTKVDYYAGRISNITDKTNIDVIFSYFVAIVQEMEKE